MKKKTGFTLIELMVAITIGMLVVGLGSISLNEFNEKQKILGVSQEVLANLRLARSYAVNNQLPENGNRVAVTIDENGLMVLKSLNVSDGDLEIISSKDITPKGITITPVTVKFSVTDGRSINGAVNINITGDDTVKNIKIEESGLIYEE